MERRRFLTLLVAVPAAFALVGCGSDGDGDGSGAGDSLPAPTEAPPATDPVPTEPSTTAASTTTLSTTTPPAQDPADEGIVVEYSELGGFTTFEYNFQSPPNVLVTTGDRVLTQAAVIEIYPGPLVPQHVEQTITPEGVARILDAAEAAGLFRDVEYDADTLIADASTATVTIVEDGTTWVHEAYALGFGAPLDGDEPSSDRAALAGFVAALSDLPALVGPENLGAPEIYVPDAYQIIAEVADVAAFEPPPTEVRWPVDTGIVLVDLATSDDCIVVEREVVGDLFDTSNELTFFVEGGVTYQVVVRPDYPGQDC